MHGRKAIALAMVTLGAVGVTQARAAQTLDATCQTLDSVLKDQATDGDTVRLMSVDCGGPHLVRSSITLVAGVPGAGFKATADERSLTIVAGKGVTLQDLRFEGAATGSGGGVEYLPVASRGGAARGADDPGLTVTNTDFAGIHNADMNGGDGGGLYAEDAAEVDLVDSSFTDNVAASDGGGAYLTTMAKQDGSTWLTVTRTTFMDNTAGKPGAGGGSGPDFAAAAVASNDAHGGGLRVITTPFDPGSRATLPPGTTADAMLSGNLLDGNTVDGVQSPAALRSGGGAAFDGTDVISEDDRFTNNIVESGTNTARGGGVDAQGATFLGINMVVAGNRVGNLSGGRATGGGIAYGGGELELVHGTVSGNSVLGDDTSGPGIFAVANGDDTVPLSLDRSIVWGNSKEAAVGRLAAQGDADDPLDDIDGRLQPSTYRQSRSDACKNFAVRPAQAAVTADDSGNVCVDPQLKTPEEGDIHLSSGSPVVDAVGPDSQADPQEGTQGRLASRILVPQDFEGQARPQGAAPDMGADELFVPPAQQQQQQQQQQQTTQTQQTGGQTPAGGVLGQTQSQPAPSGDACSSRRFFRIVLRKKKGRVYRSARIVVNGQKVKVTRFKGRPSTRIDLRRFGYQTIRVKIRAKLKGGATLTGSRTYHPCRPSLDDGRPPKL